MIDLANEKIVITGGTGFVGRHLVEYLIENRGVRKEHISILGSRQGNLRVMSNCLKLFKEDDLVFHLAGDVGAIAYSSANNARQLFNNASMGLNVVEACRLKRVRKLIIASSICAYPDDAPIPFSEENLMGADPTPSNYGYGTAKRFLVSLAKCYTEEGMNINVLLGSNIYGPGDNFDPKRSHAIPSLIRQFVEEKRIMVWGDGNSSRDYLYVRDFVKGLVLASERLETASPVNVASGKETKISEIVEIMSRLVSFKGDIIYDPKALVGQSRRVVDITKARNLLDYYPEYSIEKGISETLNWYIKQR